MPSLGHRKGGARDYAPAFLALGDPWGIAIARVWWRNGYPESSSSLHLRRALGKELPSAWASAS